MTDRKALTDTDTAALQPLAKATTACGTLDGLRARRHQATIPKKSTS